MNKLARYFLSAYHNKRLEVRKKSWILILISSVLGVLALLLSLVMLLTGALVVAGLTAVLFLFCLFTIILVKRGRFPLAVNIFLLLLFIILFSAIKFDEYVDPYETYVLAALGLFLLIISCLVGYSGFQPVIVTVLNILAVLAVYFFDILPAEHGIVSVLHLQNLFTSLIILFAGGVVGVLILKLLKELVITSEESARITSERFSRLDSAVKTKEIDSGAVGESLAVSSSRIASLVSESDKDMTVLKDQNGKLSLLIDSSEESSGHILESVKTLRVRIRDYSNSVSSVSSAVEQISRSLDNIKEGTDRRKDRVQEILEKLNTATKNVEDVRGSVDKIGSSTKNMLELIDLITDVAERTNLLAMNASIQAAHAGEKGKGFAVVAQEIRKLAEETGQSAKTISEGLSKNVNAVEEAVTKGSESSVVFRVLNQEVQEITRLFSEITGGVEEIAKGTNLVLKEADRINAASEDVDSAINTVAAMTEKNGERVLGVKRESGEVSQALTRLERLALNLKSESEQVESLGKKNLNIITSLYCQVKEISG